MHSLVVYAGHYEPLTRYHGYHVIFCQSALSWGGCAPQTPRCWIVEPSFLNPRPKTPTLKLNPKQTLLKKKTKVHGKKRKTDKYTLRLEPGIVYMQAVARTTEPPKPANRIAPLIIFYSDLLCI